MDFFRNLRETAPSGTKSPTPLSERSILRQSGHCPKGEPEPATVRQISVVPSRVTVQRMLLECNLANPFLTTVRTGKGEAIDTEREAAGKGDAKLQQKKLYMESRSLIKEQDKLEKKSQQLMKEHEMHEAEMQRLIKEQECLEKELQWAVMEQEVRKEERQQAITEQHKYAVEVQWLIKEKEFLENFELEQKKLEKELHRLMWAQERLGMEFQKVTEQQKILELEMKIKRLEILYTLQWKPEWKMSMTQYTMILYTKMADLRLLQERVVNLQRSRGVMQCQLQNELATMQLGIDIVDGRTGEIKAKLAQMQLRKEIERPTKEKEEKIKMHRKKEEDSQGTEPKANDQGHAVRSAEHLKASAHQRNIGQSQPPAPAADGSTAKCNEAPSFSKQWQFQAEFSSSGGTLQGDNSEVSLDVQKAAVTSGKVVIKGAVSTDLDRVHIELGLGHDERIVSPIIEYFAGEDFLFAKPVRISIPHFIPENCYHYSVSVCWFERDSTGKFCVRKLKPKVSGRTAGSTEGDNSNGVFFFSEPDRVVVLTDHFSGYFVCTHCKTCSPKLNLRLYGSYCQRLSRNVDLFLLVWDQRLTIKDFLEVIVPEEKKSMYLCSKTLDPPENIKDVKLGACLSVHEKDKWTLKEADGNPLFPFQQEINLQNYQPSCPKSTEERLDWALQNKPGRAPSRWFECHIDVGYIPLNDQRFLFLSCPKAQKLLVSLKFSGEDASEEALVDKGPIQCQDSTIGTTTDENGCMLHENNFGDHYQEPVNNTIVSKVQEGTHMRHVFDTVVSGICDEVYPMQQVIRGVFLLINNKSFEEARRRGRNLADRHGTEMDSSALAELFQQLGFIVVLKDNCNSKEIQEALRYEFDRRDHSSYDCFACAILSHGSNDVIFGVDGEPLPIQYLKELSAGTRCPSLISKPKLFFIQACQGSISDHGVNMLNGATVVPEPEGAYALQQRTTGVSSSSPRGQGQTCPSTADTFTAVATVHGYASFRNENQGTWFIQNLVSVFMRKANELHLAELMTETNRRVSNSETPDRRKQQPTWDSTLNRKLYFFPGLIKPRRPKIANGVPNGTI